MTDPQNPIKSPIESPIEGLNDPSDQPSNPAGKPSGQLDGDADEPMFWVTQRAARTVLIVLHVLAFGAIIFEWLFPLYPEGYAPERVEALNFTGSYAVYGFVSCVILVLLGLVLRRLVMRPEGFYREEGQ